MEELGIDRPTYAFVVSGVALQSDDGAHLQDLFNPYPTSFVQWTAAAASAHEAGLADEVGGRWRVWAVLLLIVCAGATVTSAAPRRSQAGSRR